MVSSGLYSFQFYNRLSHQDPDLQGLVQKAGWSEAGAPSAFLDKVGGPRSFALMRALETFFLPHRLPQSYPTVLFSVPSPYPPVPLNFLIIVPVRCPLVS